MKPRGIPFFFAVFLTLTVLLGLKIVYHPLDHAFYPTAGTSGEPGDQKPLRENDPLLHTTKTLAVDHSIIDKGNLFYQPTDAAIHWDTSRSTTGEVQKTSFELVLMGTIEGSNHDNRAIILSKKDGRQHLYHVGDKVGGARIKDILWDRVILHTVDRDEVLDMTEATNYRTAGLKRAVSPVASLLTPAAGPNHEESTVDTSIVEDPDNPLIPERIRIILPDEQATQGSVGN